MDPHWLVVLVFPFLEVFETAQNCQKNNGKSFWFYRTFMNFSHRLTGTIVHVYSVTSHGYHGLVCIVLLIFSWFGSLGTKLQVARNHGSLDLKIESGFSIAFEVCFQSKILIIPCIKLHHFVQSPYIRECSSYLKGIKVIFKKKGVQSFFNIGKGIDGRRTALFQNGPLWLPMSNDYGIPRRTCCKASLTRLWATLLKSMQ